MNIEIKKTDFELHMERLKNWKIVKWFMESSIAIKIIVVLALLFVSVPVIPLMMLVGSLIFIKSTSNSVWKGIISFSIATFIQIPTIFFSFILIAFNDSGDILTFGLLTCISICGWLFHQPLYALAYKIHDLNWKENDGIAYIILDIAYLIILFTWNFKMGN